MSKLLYQANPSVWRTHPFGTLVAWLLVFAGIYIAATGQIPYVSRAAREHSSCRRGRISATLAMRSLPSVSCDCLAGGSRPASTISKSAKTN